MEDKIKMSKAKAFKDAISLIYEGMAYECGLIGKSGREGIKNI